MQFMVHAKDDNQREAIHFQVGETIDGGAMGERKWDLWFRYSELVELASVLDAEIRLINVIGNEVGIDFDQHQEQSPEARQAFLGRWQASSEHGRS